MANEYTELDPMTGGKKISTETKTGSSPAIILPRSKILLGADGVDDGNVSKTNPLPIYTPGHQNYEDPIRNALMMEEEYIPIKVSSFYDNAIWVQGERRLKSVHVTKHGSEGVRIKIYDDYYDRPPTDLRFDLDATVIKDYDFHGALFNMGVYVLIEDPGSGTAPIVTFMIK